MKTKIFTVFLMTILMFSFMGTVVLADEENVIVGIGDETLSDEDVAFATANEVEDSSGIWRDKARMWFSFDKEKKAKISMKIAEKKSYKITEELEEGLGKSNGCEKVKELVKEHEDALNDAENHFDEIVLDGDAKEVVKALKRVTLRINHFEFRKEKLSNKHELLLEKKADKMNEEQLACVEDSFEMIEDKIESHLEMLKIKQENLKARLVVLGTSEERINNALEKYESVLEVKKEQREDKLEALKDKIEEKREKIKKRHELETGLKIEIDGNVKLSQTTRQMFRELTSSLKGTDENFKLELDFKKQGDSTLFVKEELEGTLTTEQTSLYEAVKTQAFADVENALGTDLELEVSIEYEAKDNGVDDLSEDLDDEDSEDLDDEDSEEDEDLEDDDSLDLN